MSSDPPNEDQSKNNAPKSGEKNILRLSSRDIPIRADIRNRIKSLRKLVIKYGIHTRNHLSTGGFEYTGDGDTARCKDCGLEISNWTSDMNPFTLHSKEKPDCPFVRSTIASSLSNVPSSSSSQKQIEHIDGKKENMVIPSIRMKQIREQNDTHIGEQTSDTTRSISNTSDVEMTPLSKSLTNESTSSQSSAESTSKSATTGNVGETKPTKPITSTARNDQEQSTASAPSNPCVVCVTEEKTLACIPCGHLATCVPCGHSLRSCAICRTEIVAYVRIYI